MALTSLEERMRAAGGPLGLLRSPRSGIFPFPIRPEFTNWRDEQESWRTAIGESESSERCSIVTFRVG